MNATDTEVQEKITKVPPQDVEVENSAIPSPPAPHFGFSK
jgi:hypothetical protein